MAFSLLFGLAGLYVVMKDRGRSFAPKEVRAAAGPGLAVLPFRVVGPDMELWREGMVDLLSTNLDGAGGIRAIAPRTVLSKWRGAFADGAEPSDPQALQIARDVGARYALIGSMVALGGEVRLAAQLQDLPKGEIRGETQVKGPPDSVPALVDRLSLELLRTGLAREPEGLTRVDLRRVTTTSLPALKAYLKGEQNFRRSRWDEAIADFTRAVEADSSFALALYRLSLAHGWIRGFSPQSIEYSERAARLIDRLPQREAWLLRANAEFERGDPAAIQSLERLTTRFPDDAEGWFMLGDAYYHIGAQLLEPSDKFRDAMRRALELDSSFGPAYIHLVWDAFTLQDSLESKKLIWRHRRIDPASPEAVGFEVAYTLAWGDSVATEAARAALDTVGTSALEAALLAVNWAPDLWNVSLQLSTALLAERHPLIARQDGQFGITRSYVRRGRLREARGARRDVAGEHPPGIEAARSILLWHVAGLPDDSTVIDAAEMLSTQSEPLDTFLVGALAVDEERWENVESAIAAMESPEQLVSRAGGQAGRQGPTNEASIEDGGTQRDSIDVRTSKALAQALGGYAAARRGDLPTAIRELRAALERLPGHCPSKYCPLHMALRYQTGRLLLQSNNPREALRYLRSVEFAPHLGIAELHVGKAYEALGDLEQARLHYVRLVRWWEECDPELQPLREEARQALKRLTGVRKL